MLGRLSCLLLMQNSTQTSCVAAFLASSGSQLLPATSIREHVVSLFEIDIKGDPNRAQDYSLRRLTHSADDCYYTSCTEPRLRRKPSFATNAVFLNDQRPSHTGRHSTAAFSSRPTLAHTLMRPPSTAKHVMQISMHCKKFGTMKEQEQEMAAKQDPSVVGHLESTKRPFSMAFNI